MQVAFLGILWITSLLSLLSNSETGKPISQFYYGGIHYLFPINPKHLNLCYIKRLFFSPFFFCDFEKLSGFVLQPLRNEPLILSKKFFCPSLKYWDISVQSCVIALVLRDRTCLWNGTAFKAASCFVFCNLNCIFTFESQAIRYIFVNIDLRLLRSFCFARIRLRISSFPAKTWTRDNHSQRGLDLNSEFIPFVADSSVMPCPCTYLLWIDEKQLEEYSSWAAFPLSSSLRSWGPLSTERLKDPKDIVAAYHHFSTACA